MTHLRTISLHSLFWGFLVIKAPSTSACRVSRRYPPAPSTYVSSAPWPGSRHTEQGPGKHSSFCWCPCVLIFLSFVTAPEPVMRNWRRCCEFTSGRSSERTSCTARAHRGADTTVPVHTAVLSLAAPGAARRPLPWICPVACAWGTLLSVLRLPDPQNFRSHHHSCPHRLWRSQGTVRPCLSRPLVAAFTPWLVTALGESFTHPMSQLDGRPGGWDLPVLLGSPHGMAALGWQSSCVSQ